MTTVGALRVVAATTHASLSARPGRQESRWRCFAKIAIFGADYRRQLTSWPQVKMSQEFV